MASSTYRPGALVEGIAGYMNHYGCRGVVIPKKFTWMPDSNVWVRWSDGKETWTTADCLRRCDGLLDV